MSPNCYNYNQERQFRNKREDGIACQFVWKSNDLRRYAVAFVRVAASRYNCAAGECAADDVPEDVAASVPHGVPGNACHILTTAHVIEPVYVAPGQIKRRMSTRESRKSAWVNVYRLCSLTSADTFLRRNDNGFEQRQSELRLEA